MSIEQKFDQVNPYPGGPGPTRSGPSSTRRPWHIPTRTGGISSAALHPERCRDRGVSAVPGDTWPTCSSSRGQLCLHDQVDLDTLTAELLAVVHQTVEPTASCSGCGRRSPRPDAQPWPDSENRHGRARVSLLLDPFGRGMSNPAHLPPGSPAGWWCRWGSDARPLKSERRPPHYPRSCVQAGERRQRSGLTASSGSRRPPHNCATYGAMRPGKALGCMAVGRGYMVRMGSPVRFRRGAPHRL